RVNLTGTFNVTQKAAAVLRNGGRVINLSSVSGQMGLFGQANYSSSKAAIIALTKVSARELARNQITVNAIAPGFIDVGMSKGMPHEVTQNFIKQIPLGRLGEVNEIVNAILFLASPMASYITGHVLNVNGGYYLGYRKLCYYRKTWRTKCRRAMAQASSLCGIRLVKSRPQPRWLCYERTIPRRRSNRVDRGEG